MLAAQQSAIYLNDHMPQIQAAQEREQLRVESIYAEERGKQGLMNLVFGVLTLVAGATALVMPVGAMWPIVVSAFKHAALATFMFGGGKIVEAGQNIYYGLSGDGKSFAINPVRDIVIGKSEIYNTVESVLTLTTGAYLPIAQTKSIVQGLWQFTWGFVGSLATGQAAYHGTKLLGGNEETAQLMNLFGNLVGGYKFYKIAENFSLNTIRVPKVESALEIENRVMENIKASKTAREHSNFKEFALNEKYQQIMNDFRPENLARRQLIEQYRSWGISPTDSVQILEISENAPKVQYQEGMLADSILETPKNLRPEPSQIYEPNFLKRHLQQFKQGAAKFQKFKPDENWRNGVVGDANGDSFWISKKHADIIEKVANGDNRLFEKLLGFDEGYFGDGPIYRLDVSPEVVAQKGVFMPTGNEDGANEWWRPGGRTYPGGIPEAVMKDISTKRGDHTWNVVN